MTYTLSGISGLSTRPRLSKVIPTCFCPSSASILHRLPPTGVFLIYAHHCSALSTNNHFSTIYRISSCFFCIPLKERGSDMSADTWKGLGLRAPHSHPRLAVPYVGGYRADRELRSQPVGFCFLFLAFFALCLKGPATLP